MYEKIIQIHKDLKIDTDELRQVLAFVKPQGYAAEEPIELTTDNPYFKVLMPVTHGSWSYQDTYTGSTCAPGMEVLTKENIPAWSMAYAGGMRRLFWHKEQVKQSTFEFLKEMLRQPDKYMPIRGPLFCHTGDFTYILTFEGDITSFRAVERILYKGAEVFRQDFIGGLIVHKLT